MMKAEDPDTDARGSAAAIAQWIALERFKREMRGIPALAPCNASEARLLRSQYNAARSTPRALIVEAEVTSTNTTTTSNSRIQGDCKEVLPDLVKTIRKESDTTPKESLSEADPSPHHPPPPQEA